MLKRQIPIFQDESAAVSTDARTDARRDSSSPGTNLIDIALRRKWTVIITLACCLTIAAAYLCLATRIYTSTSRLYVEQNGTHLLSQDAQSADARPLTYLFRQAQLIRSETILRQALSANPAVVQKMYPGVSDPLAILQKNLSVDVGKQDDIITVELSSAYSAEAATLLNSIVACYESYQSKQMRSTSDEALSILQTEKDKQEALLDQRLKEIADFKSKNGEMFFTNDKGTNILMQHLATISEELTQCRLNDITIHIRAAHSDNLSIARNSVAVSDAQVEAFQKEFDDAKENALKINAAQAEFQKMQVEADRTSKLCDVLDTRIKELNVTANGGSMNIQVLEVAKAETHPTSPKKSMTLLAVLVVGLILGVGGALLRDRLDQLLHMPDEASRILGLRALGSVPVIKDGSVNRQEIGCASNLEPCGELADAHQSIAVAVHIALPLDGDNVLLITSPNRGDGKSTTSSNLAISMALSGRRTLLIDADLRRPVQHEIFGQPNTVGLTDVISRDARLGLAIQTTRVDGLSLITSGQQTSNPSEVLRSHTFKEILRTLKDDYEVIIIDAPPILAAPDARTLGIYADVALLVLRAGRSTRQDANEAANRLRSVGVKVLGFIFNATTRARSMRNYGYEDEVESGNQGNIQSLAKPLSVPPGQSPITSVQLIR